MYITVVLKLCCTSDLPGGTLKLLMPRLYPIPNKAGLGVEARQQNFEEMPK